MQPLAPTGRVRALGRPAGVHRGRSTAVRRRWPTAARPGVTMPGMPPSPAAYDPRRARWGEPLANVTLRPIEDSDLDALFDQMRDPDSVQVAAFTAKDPDDRNAFDIHMSKVRTSGESRCAQ
jgi:hypothetical protein